MGSVVCSACPDQDPFTISTYGNTESHTVDSRRSLHKSLDQNHPTIYMNIVEQHIYLRQEAARERIRHSQDRTSPQSLFSNLNINSSLLEGNCEEYAEIGDRMEMFERKIRDLY